MRVCQNCGKSYKRAMSRSHSMRTTIRRLQPNLHWKKIMGRRMRLCTQCIKSLGKGKIAIEKQLQYA